MLSENYVMINELMNSKWTSAQLKTSLTSFKKSSIQQKDSNLII
jgi:hypothetical protein